MVNLKCSTKWKCSHWLNWILMLKLIGPVKCKAGRVTCTSTNAKPPARPRGRPRTRSSAATEAATGEVAAVSPSSAIDNHNNSSSVSIHSDVVSEIVVPSVVVEPPRGEKVLCCFCLAIFFHPDVLLRHQREAHKEEMRIGAAAATAASAGNKFTRFLFRKSQFFKTWKLDEDDELQVSWKWMSVDVWLLTLEQKYCR